VKHRAVGSPTAAETMPLHSASKTLALGGTGNIHIISGFEDVGTQFLSRLIAAGLQAKFPERPEESFVRLAEMTLERLSHVFLFDPAISQLYCFVTILFRGLPLNDH